MTKQEAYAIQNEIINGYHDRDDYPPLKPASWDDRNAYKQWIFKIIEEHIDRPAKERKAHDSGN